MGNFNSMPVRIVYTVIAVLTLALATATNAWAYRVLGQIEDAYELALDQVTLPSRETGSISFRVCESCPTTFLSVTTATKYQRSGEQMNLSDFIALVDEIRNVNSGVRRDLIYVFINIESKRVTRIVLD